MATQWELCQLASEKEQELQALRQQHTHLLEETIAGTASHDMQLVAREVVL